jgi:16S rRNA (uracil1498-N3)-methyltransferase
VVGDAFPEPAGLESAGPEIGFPADTPAVAHTFVGDLSDDLEVEGDDGHHLARVRRLEVGEAITAADGTGRWRSYEVVAVGRGSITLTASGVACREPRLVPWLRVAFALTKGQKPETVVRQLTELGVDAVVPVLAARSVVRVRGQRADDLTARLTRVAREAACQSRRARITAVELPCALADLVAAAGAGLVVADRGGSPGPGDPGRDVPGSEQVGAGGWTLLVGPEGGFAPAEQEHLEGVPRVAVGPHVLRAETASVAAAALLTTRRHAATP